MLGIHSYWLFVVAAILLNITPGTDTMYIIARSASQGRRAGIFSSLGIAAGTVVHTVLAALGLSLLLAKSAVLFTVIKIIGVAYLVYLGINMIRSKSSDLGSASLQPAQMSRIFWQGAITNVTNPKVGIFFLAFLPQFVETGTQSPVPFLLLGLTFIVTGTAWNCLVAYFASFATAKLRKKPRIGVWLNKATGVVFIGLGLNLLRAKISN